MNLSFLIALLTGEAADVAARARRSAVTYLVAALAAVLGLVFLLVAGFIFVSENLRLGPLNTALAMGGGFLALALIVLVFHRVRAKARARRARERRQGDLKAAAGAAMIAALPALLARRGGLAALALPAVAAVALAIWRENARPKNDDDDVD